MRALAVLRSVFPYQAKRLAWGNISAMTLFCVEHRITVIDDSLQNITILWEFNPETPIGVLILDPAGTGRYLSPYQQWSYVVFKPVFVCVFMLSWLQQLFAVLFIDLMLMTDWLHVSDMTLCSCLVCRWFHQLPSLLVWRCWLQTPPKSDGSVVSSCFYLVITLNFLTKSNITVQNGLEKLDSRLLAMTSKEDKIACESVRKLCGMLEEEVSVRGQWTLIMFSSNYLLF